MRKKLSLSSSTVCLALLILAVGPLVSSAQSSANIHQATLVEVDQKTPEVSTEEVRKILAEKSATVFDARPFKEYAISHLPGAVNVSAKAGVPISFYVSDVAEIGAFSRTTRQPR